MSILPLSKATHILSLIFSLSNSFVPNCADDNHLHITEPSHRLPRPVFFLHCRRILCSRLVFIAKPFHNHFNHHLSSLIRIRLCPNRNKGFEFSKNIMEIEEDAHLMDEFSYEDDDVRCSVNYELHVAFSERRRIRIGSSSVVRYTIRWMPKAVIFSNRMPKAVIFSSSMIARYKKMCGN